LATNLKFTGAAILPLSGMSEMESSRSFQGNIKSTMFQFRAIIYGLCERLVEKLFGISTFVTNVK
jgi:hypothetical protein